MQFEITFLGHLEPSEVVFGAILEPFGMLFSALGADFRSRARRTRKRQNNKQILMTIRRRFFVSYRFFWRLHGGGC